MKIKQYLKDLNVIQKNILKFIDDDKSDFQHLQQIFYKQKLQEDKHNLRLFLRQILIISNHHHRSQNFFNKIDIILGLFKEKMKKYYSNYELFNIFESNKRILLFLIEEKIIEIDINIIKMMISDEKYKFHNYYEFFAPEIKKFINESFLQKHLENEVFQEITKDQNEIFFEKRKNGENDNFICEMIRKDSIIEFITNYNKLNFSVESEIKPSIFETNSYLLDIESISLIEYAAFYGSIQIFKFLFNNGAGLNPSIWLCAIYSNNPELIHFLEENHVDNNLGACVDLAIYCFHNDVVKYLQIELTNEQIIQNLGSYNFYFLQEKNINQSSFIHFFQYDYYILVDILLKDLNIDINAKDINDVYNNIKNFNGIIF